MKSGEIIKMTPLYEPQLIGIRADANEEAASGHIMRCLTIAEELKKSGNKVIFFTADESAAERISGAGFEWRCLKSDWKNMENELPALKAGLEKMGCRKLLVDSYHVSGRYFEALSDLCKLIYIDDCFEEIYPVDMIINYNAYHTRFNYKECYPEKTRLLLGTSYVPLREEFHAQESAAADGFGKSGDDRNTRNSEAHVLISCGGGDKYNALTGILEALTKDKELREVVFQVIVGGYNPNAAALKLLSKEHDNIKLHYDIKNMAALMNECGAAVSAAGTMLFELSAMRLPSVFFVCADNQKYDSEFFAKEERMLFAGDIRKSRTECIGNICAELKRLLADEALKDRMREALGKVTDGNGARRIAKEIEAL